MRRTVILVLLVTSMLLSALPASSQQQDPCAIGVQPPPAQCTDGEDGTDPRIQRFAGPTRIETALAISAATFSAADTVVIVRADLYPDAVVAGPYAEAVGGPVLLASAHGLDDATADEIRRLGANRAAIIGGEAAVPAVVHDDLTGLGLTVDRFAGDSRFSTAVAVAEALADVQGSSSTAVLSLGEGDDGWFGPIAFGPAAAATGAPLLLTAAGRLPDDVAEWVAGNVDTVVIGDGPGRVPDAVVAALEDSGVTVQRPVASDDPYATSVDAAGLAIAAGADPAVIYVVTDRAFADGLGAGASAATNDGVVVIVDGDDPAGAPQVGEFLRDHCAAVAFVRIAGGTVAVSDAVEDALAESLSCAAPDGPTVYFTQPDSAYETSEDTADLVVATEGGASVELLADLDGDGTAESSVATLDVEADGGIADFVDVALAEGPNRFAARATLDGRTSRLAPAPVITRRAAGGGSPSGPEPLDDELEVVAEQGVVVAGVLDEYVDNGTIESYDADPDFTRLAYAQTRPGEAQDAKTVLEDDDRIAEVNAVYPARAAQVTDPQAEQQPQLDDVQPHGAWAVTNDGAGYTVGIIDSGFDDAHEDLPAFLAHDHDDGEECTGSHGTETAGIILARAGAPGITGLANQADLVALSAGRLDPDGECGRINYGWGDLRRMATGPVPADVMNASFGSTWQGNATTHGRELDTTAGRRHYDYVTNRGMLVVASSGNDANDVGYDRDTAFHTPSGYDQVMSVGATRTGTSSWADFSQWEPELDLAAPGSPVVSTTNGNAYEYVNGTSFAAPHVAGAAVLVSEATGDTHPWRIRHRLVDHAQDINGADRTDRLGEGQLDVTAAATSRAVRLAGGDRFGTSEEIGREALPPVPDGASPDRAHLVERVVVVPARDWQVALPSMVLAHETDTTVVTSEVDRLPDASLREIRRSLGIDMGLGNGETSLPPADAIAVYPGTAGRGGVEAAVRTAVDTAGLPSGLATTRVELPGTDAHEIAVSVADHHVDRSGEPTDVLVATTNGFADALAFGAAAARHGYPLLFSDIDGVANVTCAWLADRPSLTTVHIAGGAAAVSEAAAAELGDCAGPSVTIRRHAGGERVETAVRIAEFFFPVGSDYTIRPALASAEIPADSIIGGLLAAHTGGPVYITRNGTTGPGQPVRPLESLVAGSVGGSGGQHYTTGYVLGGTAVIGSHLYDDWDAALGGQRTAPPPPGTSGAGPGPYAGEFVQTRDQLLCDDSRPAGGGEAPDDGGRIELLDPILVHDLCNTNDAVIGVEWTYTMSAADAAEVDDIAVVAFPNRAEVECDDMVFGVRGRRTGGTWDVNIHEVGSTANCNLHELFGPVRSGDARVVDFATGDPNLRFVGLDWLTGTLPPDDYLLFFYAGAAGDYEVGDASARIRVD